ncbi:MAG: tRNA lysidine(34) synthetase TilS [Bacteroidales bacterium]|nr:tRNA lysidine(34) synthetase TilS [Bacteroidales bacterium]
MLGRFKQFVAGQHLFSSEQTVLLAVSGGRDSVCLAHLMHSAGFRFAVAHCNFHLRPGDCDRDQRFVEALAARLGVEFHTVDFDTSAFASAHAMGVEEAARSLRYGWFAGLAARCGYLCLATAHHRDDSVESMLLNLVRGTGLHGLHGIRPANRGTLWPAPSGGLLRLDVVHPMLPFSRADIDRYVADNGLDYVEDVTNAVPDVRRNRVRLQLMPLLRQLNPDADRVLADTMERLAEAEVLYNERVAELAPTVVATCRSPFGYDYSAVDIGRLLALRPQLTLAHELLTPFGFSAAQIADLLRRLGTAVTGACFASATHEAVVDRGRLLLRRSGVLPPPSVSVTEAAPGPLRHEAAPVCLSELVDADCVALPLRLRPWAGGDRFQPLGMDRPRLVSDFIKDRKLSLLDKRRLFMLEDACGRPVWLVGLRLDHRVRITASTTRALSLKASFNPS